MIYVCSDIHGQYGMFKLMLERIGFSENDHMYIIGDVIDRGPEPVPLLLDVMNRKNVTLMIGNHEHMMIQALLYDNTDEYNDWMYNGGSVTCRQLRELGRVKTDILLRRLEKHPLVIPNLSVNGRTFYFAHSAHTLYPEKETLLYRDAGEQNRERVLWSREFRHLRHGEGARKQIGYQYRSLYEKYKGSTLIIGHSPVYRCSYGIVTGRGFCRISRAFSGHLINLDCGCALGATLGVLRLDDMKEFYIDCRPLDMKYRIIRFTTKNKPAE